MISIMKSCSKCVNCHWHLSDKCCKASVWRYCPEQVMFSLNGPCYNPRMQQGSSPVLDLNHQAGWVPPIPTDDTVTTVDTWTKWTHPCSAVVCSSSLSYNQIFFWPEHFPQPTVQQITVLISNNLNGSPSPLSLLLWSLHLSWWKFSLNVSL